MARPPDTDTAAGFAYAISAYVFWGFLPLYMKAMDHMSALEVLGHRVIWSVPIAAAILIVLGRTDTVKTALRTPSVLAMAAVTAVLVSVNWGVYVWAILNDKALDAALGYYINPLFSVFLGFVLLGEKLNAMKWAAIALAVGAVVVLTVDAGGRIPLVAVILTLTWGFYAFFKRSLPVGPNQGFFLEVLILTPPALLLIGWLAAQGERHFMAGSSFDTLMLMAGGLVTAIPLMIYANGAKGLRLSTIGILQYIAPTMIFLIAVFVFDEPFGTARMIAFPLIWAALAVYSVALLQERAARTRKISEV